MLMEMINIGIKLYGCEDAASKSAGLSIGSKVLLGAGVAVGVPAVGYGAHKAISYRSSSSDSNKSNINSSNKGPKNENKSDKSSSKSENNSRGNSVSSSNSEKGTIRNSMVKSTGENNGEEIQSQKNTVVQSQGNGEEIIVESAQTASQNSQSNKEEVLAQANALLQEVKETEDKKHFKERQDKVSICDKEINTQKIIKAESSMSQIRESDIDKAESLSFDKINDLRIKISDALVALSALLKEIDNMPHYITDAKQVSEEFLKIFQDKYSTIKEMIKNNPHLGKELEQIKQQIQDKLNDTQRFINSIGDTQREAYQLKAKYNRIDEKIKLQQSKIMPIYQLLSKENQ